MAKHLLVEADPLARLVAKFIGEYMIARDCIFGVPNQRCDGPRIGVDNETDAAVEMCADIAKVIVNRLAPFAQEIELAPGDRLAKMSDVHAAVRSIMDEIHSQPKGTA